MLNYQTVINYRTVCEHIESISVNHYLIKKLWLSYEVTDESWSDSELTHDRTFFLSKSDCLVFIELHNAKNSSQHCLPIFQAVHFEIKEMYRKLKVIFVYDKNFASSVNHEKRITRDRA